MARSAAFPSPRPSDSPFYNEGEAAAFLRIAPGTLSNLRLSGKGPRFRRHGKGVGARICYERGDLLAWSLGNARLSTSDSGPPDQPLAIVPRGGAR